MNNMNTAGTPGFPNDGAPLTPSDTTTFTPSVLYIGGAGNVKVVTAAGNTRTFAVTAGQTLGCMVTKVFQTDTTATLLVRYW